MDKISFITSSNIFIDNEISLPEGNMSNKLFCTFTPIQELDETIDTILSRYTISYGKIFILSSPQSEELICTYNIDLGNFSDSKLPNTVLLHRKKEANVLYTINALNNLIKSLNDGRSDKNFIINWNDYKNSILLTNGNDVRQLNTVIYKIIDLNK